MTDKTDKTDKTETAGEKPLVSESSQADAVKDVADIEEVTYGDGE